MKEEKEFINFNVSAGQWIYNFILLQFLPIAYTLKGAVVLGIFPSLASTFHVLYRWIAHKQYDLSVAKEFKQFYKENFWQTNKIGWIMALIGAVLTLDLYVSSQFIQSIFLHTFLVVLFFIYLAVCCYLFPVFARYDFSQSRQYVKQAFFIGLSSMAQTVAVLLAVVVMSYIFSYIPFLLLFFGIPFMLGPIAWFTVQGMLRVETIKLKE